PAQGPDPPAAGSRAPPRTGPPPRPRGAAFRHGPRRRSPTAHDFCLLTLLALRTLQRRCRRGSTRDAARAGKLRGTDSSAGPARLGDWGRGRSVAPSTGKDRGACRVTERESPAGGQPNAGTRAAT